MTVQIAIIGLGQIGASIGLALKDHKDLVQRIGHDLDPRIARQAQKMGAIDRADFNLPSAVSGADLVILSLPVDQIRETVQFIIQDLREGCVVMDTGPAKESVAAWMSELLPQGRHYVGLTPVLNPAYLWETDQGIDAARPDLFKTGLVAIVAPPGCDSGAIKLAADLTRLIGSSPLFADPLEVDGLMAATHLLPQLVAAALVNATVDQPGWREGRKMAGRAYAESTSAVMFTQDGRSLASAALLNRENTLRVLDSAIASLSALRNDIDQQDEPSLEDRLKRARVNREAWWKGRQKQEWANDGAVDHVDMPDAQSVFGRLLGIRKKPKSAQDK
jgi:prephenate dehydrogenase